MVCHLRSIQLLPTGVCVGQQSSDIWNWAISFNHGLQSISLSPCRMVPGPKRIGVFVGMVRKYWSRRVRLVCAIPLVLHKNATR